jgi:hypothetical protein
MTTLDWRLLTPDALADDPQFAEQVKEFRSVDRPLGRAAARWLREDAADNDGSTKTYCLLGDDRLEGFFALCAGEVRLARRDVADLDVSIRARQPAIVLAWIARHRDATEAGAVLLETAFGLARGVAQDIGAIAFVLDPGDDDIAARWADRGFRESLPRWDGAPRRLWLPLNLDQEEG